MVVLKAAWSMLVTSSDDKSRSVPTNYVSMVTVPPSSLVMSTLAHLLVGMTVPRENTHAVGEHRHLWVQSRCHPHAGRPSTEQRNALPGCH